MYLIQETPEFYREITVKQLEKEKFNIDWVYNILDHKEEQDKIVFEDADPETGFVFLPDFKWDCKTIESLHMLAIVMDRKIKSMRDLNETHLPMLKKVRDTGLKTIEEKYGITKSQIRAFFHYQPSFYHLHIHFTFLRFEVPGCEKNHLLDTVINNISLMSDYYQRATITFLVKENDGLFSAYRDILFPDKAAAEPKTAETSV